jgi:hypothetical protein
MAFTSWVPMGLKVLGTLDARVIQKSCSGKG